MVVRHKCDNPQCVNLEHLELGTQLDNITDRDSRGRTARGATNARTKVSPELVDLILKSPLSSRKLAAQLGVSHTTIQWARRGLTYHSAACATL